MNIGKGGIVALVVGEGQNRQRRPEEEIPTIGETYAVTLCGGSGAAHAAKSKLTMKGDLRMAAEQVRGLTGWDCPVDASSLRAYFDADVEGKRTRDEEDVGRRTGLHRTRAETGEGSSSATPSSQQSTDATSDTMDTEQSWKIAQTWTCRS